MINRKSQFILDIQKEYKPNTILKILLIHLWPILKTKQNKLLS